jgi:hypothetical protein
MQVCVVRFSGLRPVLVKLHTLASWTGHMSSLESSLVRQSPKEDEMKGTGEKWEFVFILLCKGTLARDRSIPALLLSASSFMQNTILYVMIQVVS